MDPTRAFDPSKMKAEAAEYSASESEEDDDEYLMPSTNPNADEFADFNPRKRRRTGRDAKESAALGIFGSESEDDKPGKRWKRNTLRNKGMSFVSADDAKKSNEDDAMAEDEDDDEDPERASFFHMNGGKDLEDNEDHDEGPTVGIGLGYSASAGLGRGRE